VVKKPGQTQEEWAYQGEYRVWSKRYASFNLPLSVECLTQTGKKLPFVPVKRKKPPGLTPVAFKGAWLLQPSLP
jgi:hypothetical protein